MNKNKQPEASLMRNTSGSYLANLTQLKCIETPKPTKTWTPTPHADVPQAITRMVMENNWDFIDKTAKRFQISVTNNDQKMFGVTRINIPGVKKDDEFGIALGFRNSHNKTLALRFALGTSVFVCDNLIMDGDFFIRREHTKNITVLETVRSAFEMIPEIAKARMASFAKMRGIKFTPEMGIAFLAAAVDNGALPLTNFLDARINYLDAYDKNNGNGQILHGRTLWGAYQAVTEQWKSRSMMQVPVYTKQLAEVVSGHMPSA